MPSIARESEGGLKKHNEGGCRILAHNVLMSWRVILQPDPETGDWAIWCPELKGCASAGRTREEAIENIKEAIALYLEPLPVSTPPGAMELRVAV